MTTATRRRPNRVTPVLTSGWAFLAWVVVCVAAVPLDPRLSGVVWLSTTGALLAAWADRSRRYEKGFRTVTLHLACPTCDAHLRPRHPEGP